MCMTILCLKVDAMCLYSTAQGETEYFCYLYWNMAEKEEFRQAKPGRRHFTINRAFEPVCPLSVYVGLLLFMVTMTLLSCRECKGFLPYPGLEMGRVARIKSNCARFCTANLTSRAI